MGAQGQRGAFTAAGECVLNNRLTCARERTQTRTLLHTDTLKLQIRYQIIFLPSSCHREDSSHHWCWTWTAPSDTSLMRAGKALFGLFICLWFSNQDKPRNKFQVCFKYTPGYKSHACILILQLSMKSHRSSIDIYASLPCRIHAHTSTRRERLKGKRKKFYRNNSWNFSKF